MKGNNTITLCASEMMKGIEFYLKQVLFKDTSFKVTRISKNQEAFDIKLEEEKEKENE